MTTPTNTPTTAIERLPIIVYIDGAWYSLDGYLADKLRELLVEQTQPKAAAEEEGGEA